MNEINRVLGEAASLNSRLYKGYIKSTDPLWMRLIHREQNYGLRKVSHEWHYFSSRLLKKIKNETPENIHSESQTSDFLKYRLNLKCETRDPLLLFRIRISQNFNSKILIEIENSNFNSFDKGSLMASCLVPLTRQNSIALCKRVIKSLAPLQRKSIKHLSIDQVLTMIHINNSVSYYYFKHSQKKALDLITKTTRIIRKAKFDRCLKNHLLGLNYFHLSQYYRADNRISGELKYLKKASQLDVGFCDYYYRIAQIYHDKMDKMANKFYLKALKVSPFHDSLINDYGIYLKQLGSKEDFKRFETIYKKLDN